MVTGGKGFLGRHLCDALRDSDYKEVHAVGRGEADLDSHQLTLRLFQQIKPDVVFHLAAEVGGIDANRRNPAVFWRNNLMMGINVMDAALAVGVKKLVMVGTTCSYPKRPAKIPFPETELFNGYPEETNAPYGIAKLALLVGAQAFRKQFGLDVVTAVPTNLYGPHDNVDLLNSHVIPALLQRMHSSYAERHKTFTAWGTGTATRDFLYVRDAARGLIRMMERYSKPEPLNLGSGEEVSIRDLVNKIAHVVGFKGSLKFDHTKPDGQPRRCLDASKARIELDWVPRVQLDEGLRVTYEWVRSLTPSVHV